MMIVFVVLFTVRDLQTPFSIPNIVESMKMVRMNWSMKLCRLVLVFVTEEVYNVVFDLVRKANSIIIVIIYFLN